MKVDLEELERKAKAAKSAVNAPWYEPNSATLALAKIDSADIEHIAAVSPDVVIALGARIRELEEVSALAYDLTHEEGALSLQAGDTLDAEDLDKIERRTAALLQLGKLHRKGVVLP